MAETGCRQNSAQLDYWYEAGYVRTAGRRSWRVIAGVVAVLGFRQCLAGFRNGYCIYVRWDNAKTLPCEDVELIPEIKTKVISPFLTVSDNGEVILDGNKYSIDTIQKIVDAHAELTK